MAMQQTPDYDDDGDDDGDDDDEDDDEDDEDDVTCLKLACRCVFVGLHTI